MPKPFDLARRVALFALPLALCAQERPLSIYTTVYTGYYETTTRGQVNQSLQFFPLGASFDINGFLLSPDLLMFSVQPEVALGPQASEAGIDGGNGVRLEMTLLRKRAFPLTFRYSNVQVQDVYFGSLSQVSGYRMQNRTKDIGVTWEVRPLGKELSVIFDWGKGSVDSKSDLVEVPDYVSQQNHYNLDARYERSGWDLQAFGHRQQQQSNILVPTDGSASPGILTQNVDQLQLSARRSFLKDSEFYVDGGMQQTQSMLFTLPLDLRTNYANMNLRLFQRRRWKTSLRAGYSSNIASQLLAQEATTLAAPGSIAPVSTVMLPFSHGISNLDINATTTADLAYGFGVFGSLERNEVLSSDQSGPLNSNYFTSTAGVNYSKRFSWGSVNGQYGRELGYGSITGQSGTIVGQTYLAGFTHSAAGGMVLEGSVHGNDQTVNNSQPLSEKSFSADAGVSFHVAGDFSTRLGGGWQRSSFVSSGTEFKSHGYTARASIDHPRVQASASLNDSLGNSLPFSPQSLGLGVGSILLNPLLAVPSDYRALSFALHANPIRKLEISGTFTHSLQHLDGVLSNNFELMNFTATYHFRKLQVESGYIRFNQAFSLYPNLNRTRFYVRVQRTARIL